MQTSASPGDSAGGSFLARHARELGERYAKRVLPWWYDTTVDRERGGFLLAATEKHLVGQSRMIWGFSHGALAGYEDDARDYAGAARRGVEFLERWFLDPKQGGYRWTTELDGSPRSDLKYLYGQAFVVYAFVEHFRATGEARVLERALDLFAAVQRRCRDHVHGGWGEHFTAEWRPATKSEAADAVEIPGLKSANAHLHWMEALTELYDATRKPAVRDALDEALQINRSRFFPADQAHAALHRKPDWKRPFAWRSPPLSFGHNVEAAWLMAHTQQVLGAAPDREHFDSLLDFALLHGEDRERGGLYETGSPNGQPVVTDKVWWVQAEFLAALTVRLTMRGDPAAEASLVRLLEFVELHQTDPKSGVWYSRVAADGTLLNGELVSSWKANYHDFRAISAFIAAFAPRAKNTNSPESSKER